MEKIDLFVTDEDPDLKRSGSAGSDLPEEEDPDLDPAAERPSIERERQDRGSKLELAAGLFVVPWPQSVRRPLAKRRRRAIL